MGRPKIEINFKSVAATAIERSARGVVGLVLVDKGITLKTDPLSMTDITDAPEGLSPENKKEVSLAFDGYSGATKKVMLTVVNKGDDQPLQDTDFVNACKKFLNTDVTYIAVPDVDTHAKAVADFVSGTRGSTKASQLKAVLSGVKADNEAIVNFTTNGLVAGSETYTAAQYTPRIAAVLATCPMTSSATYYVLSDLDNCEYIEDEALDAAIDAGELKAFWDGEKVKIARAVNSLTTTTADKSEEMKKIRTVDTLDTIRHDIHRTLEDNYVGKYPNSATYKQMVCNAINGYYEELIGQGAIESGNCEINLDKQRTYLKQKGKAVDKMSDVELLNANTDSHVFLKGSTKPLDAMEDIEYDISLN